MVSPEIRANCTLRICLRTTDEADSRDVLGSPHAAHLPIDHPGRAFLRAGAARPTAFQVAGSPSPAAARDGRSRGAALGLAARPRASGDGHGRGAPTWPGCPALARARGAAGLPAPHRPWRPRCPTASRPPARPCVDRGRRPAADGTCCRRPGRPAGQPGPGSARLDLADGGAWLAVGGPRSGRTTFCAPSSVRPCPSRPRGAARARAGLRRRRPGRRGRRAARTPARVSGDEPCARSDWSTGWAGGRARRAATGTDAAPAVLLLVDGMEALSTLLTRPIPAAGRRPPAPAPRRRRGRPDLRAHRRPGRAGGPAGGRRRGTDWCCRCPTAPTTRWPVSRPARCPPPATGSRAVGEDALECQLALPRPARRRGRRRDATARSAPLRIAGARPIPVLPLPDAGRRPCDRPLCLPVGPGGDEGEPLAVDLLRTGGLLVTGPPGAAVHRAEAFAQHLQAHGVPRPSPRAPPPAPPATTATAPSGSIRPTRGLAAWLAELAGRPGRRPRRRRRLAGGVRRARRAPGAGPGSRVALLAAASAGQFAGHYQGRSPRCAEPQPGCCSAPGRVTPTSWASGCPRTPLPVRPGSGWLVTGARDGAGAGGPTRRRGPGPTTGVRAARAPARSPGVAYQASS